MLPDVDTDLTVEALERLPKLEGYGYELDEGRLRIAAAAPMPSWQGDLAFRVTVPTPLWWRSSRRVRKIGIGS